MSANKQLIVGSLIWVLAGSAIAAFTINNQLNHHGDSTDHGNTKIHENKEDSNSHEKNLEKEDHSQTKEDHPNASEDHSQENSSH